MAAPAIEFEDVSKRYRLGQRLGGYTTLREVLAARFRGDRAAADGGDIWALRGVSFTVDEGETLGLIGANGAGKTTALKVLARITQPTAGVSRTRGRVGALLEVGTGFHPELTGAENVYLNGALLGLKRHEIRRRFDEIVEFSGLERFLETPLKRYSWGMYLRLAFAVAAHVEPDVLLVDEVLASGDVRFRERCLGKITEFGREGRTVVFVSHDLGSVTRVCRRALWIEQGEIRAEGRSEDVVDRYVKTAVERSARAEFALDDRLAVQLVSAAITDGTGALLEQPRRDQPFAITANLLVREHVPGLDFAFSVRNGEGVAVLDERWGLDTGNTLVPERTPLEYEATLLLPPLLAAGDYIVSVWIGTSYETLATQDALAFRLRPRPDDHAKAVERSRIVQPDVRWHVAPVGPAPRLAR